MLIRKTAAVVGPVDKIDTLSSLKFALLEEVSYSDNEHQVLITNVFYGAVNGHGKRTQIIRRYADIIAVSIPSFEIFAVIES